MRIIDRVIYAEDGADNVTPILESDVAYVSLPSWGCAVSIVLSRGGRIVHDMKDTRSRILPRLRKAGYVRMRLVNYMEICIHPSRIVWELVPSPARFSSEDCVMKLPVGTREEYVSAPVTVSEMNRLMSVLAESGTSEARDWLDSARTPGS